MANNKLLELFSPLRGSIYLIEGIIAVGKTTCGKSLEKFLKDIGLEARFYQEYVNEVRLAEYISDMKKYAFSFQMFMLEKRIEIYRQAEEFASKGGIAFIDRSIVGDVTFAQMQRDNGNFTEDQWIKYCSAVGNEQDLNPTACIYPKCSTETAMKRLHRRNRSSEVNGYTSEYMEQLRLAYEKVIRLCNAVKYIVIDWDKDRDLVDGLLSSGDCIEILKLLL